MNKKMIIVVNHQMRILQEKQMFIHIEQLYRKQLFIAISVNTRTAGGNDLQFFSSLDRCDVCILIFCVWGGELVQQNAADAQGTVSV